MESQKLSPRKIADEEAKKLSFSIDGTKYRLSDLIQDEELQKRVLRQADINTAYEAGKNDLFWALVKYRRQKSATTTRKRIKLFICYAHTRMKPSRMI